MQLLRASERALQYLFPVTTMLYLSLYMSLGGFESEVPSHVRGLEIDHLWGHFQRSSVSDLEVRRSLSGVFGCSFWPLPAFPRIP